jgi:hypothetical protein
MIVNAPAVRTVAASQESRPRSSNPPLHSISSLTCTNAVKTIAVPEVSAIFQLDLVSAARRPVYLYPETDASQFKLVSTACQLLLKIQICSDSSAQLALRHHTEPGTHRLTVPMP